METRNGKGQVLFPSFIDGSCPPICDTLQVNEGPAEQQPIVLAAVVVTSRSSVSLTAVDRSIRQLARSALLAGLLRLTGFFQLRCFFRCIDTQHGSTSIALVR
jgi:hypothetical protein